MNSKLYRIKKLLGLIPILHKNPGITADELSRLAGLSGPKDVERLLSSLLMIGRPPFSPGDYLDIRMDADGSLYLDSAQGLDKPFQINPAEWNALFTVTEYMRNFGLMNTEESENLNSVLSAVANMDFSADNAGWLNKKRILEEAIQDRCSVEFTYKSVHSSEPELRQADPYAVISHKGAAYLAARCHQRNAVRFFNLDRMENPEIIHYESFKDPPANLNSLLLSSPIFTENDTGITVSIAFHKSAYNGLAFRLNLKNITEESGDWYRADAKIGNTEWFTDLIKKFGVSAVVLKPDHIREKILRGLQNTVVPELISE